MGYSEARNVRMSDSIMGGRIFGDRIDEAKRVCAVREVSGLKPWELAKIRVGVKPERVEREEQAVEEFLEREEQANEVLFELVVE